MGNILIHSELQRHSPRRTAHSRHASSTPGARIAAICASVMLLGLTAGGCVGSRTYDITVDAKIPEPLIEPAAKTIGVYYTPDFSAYKPQEESLLGDVYAVDFGDLQRRYFHSMLEAAFERVVVTDSADADVISSHDVDFFVVPRAENFSFLTPTESGSKFFAVSMRHYIEFYQSDGAPFGTWEINSYGRSRSSFGASTTRLAEEACQDALRDMATSIIVGLPEQLRNRGLAATAATDETPAQSN